MGIRLSDARIPRGTRVYAIGDIHGCIDQLNLMLALIERDLAENPVDQHYLIFVGDYVDRGPDSAGVVKQLIKLQKTESNVICLKGNHEEKFLEFLADPRPLASGFFAYGGIETSLSYGLKEKQLLKPLRDAAKIRDLLLDKIPKKHLQFYQSLGLSFSIGDYFFCHAGIRPGIKLKQQSSHDLMWIRREFLSYHGLHKKIIVHGHTPYFEPEIMANRINVDTKCYDSGVLSCVVLERREQRIIQTI